MLPRPLTLGHVVLIAVGSLIFKTGSTRNRSLSLVPLARVPSTRVWLKDVLSLQVLRICLLNIFYVTFMKALLCLCCMSLWARVRCYISEIGCIFGPVTLRTIPSSAKVLSYCESYRMSWVFQPSDDFVQCTCRECERCLLECFFVRFI